MGDFYVPQKTVEPQIDYVKIAVSKRRLSSLNFWLAGSIVTDHSGAMLEKMLQRNDQQIKQKSYE